MGSNPAGCASFKTKKPWMKIRGFLLSKPGSLPARPARIAASGTAHVKKGVSLDSTTATAHPLPARWRVAGERVSRRWGRFDALWLRRRRRAISRANSQGRHQRLGHFHEGIPIGPYLRRTVFADHCCSLPLTVGAPFQPNVGFAVAMAMRNTASNVPALLD